MKLTPRLLTIAKLIPQNTVVADIGTDHAYIPVYLIKNKIAKRVIAADVNNGPLQSAQKNIALHHMENYIETRLGNGLEILHPGEVDTVIIAGMGGLLIRDILTAHPAITSSIDTFVLQPMVAQDDLRRWLLNNGFMIVNEGLVKEDHRIYEVMVVKKGIQSVIDDIYYELGEKLIENNDPLLIEFIRKHLKKYNEILSQLAGQNSEIANEKRNMCLQKVEKLEEVLSCLNNVKQS
ncbi:tRNA (adenine22-N1)-methyltransferase [Anaerosolibacter carboniphilus]|uniref:tRNA (Adenine22-N1)-methyltransferase n=1 Tax=Anaerosolibacter carboniphilus TaxID=1417629 RepID=A0A841KW33_9FIRM|nr:class I SAM-dependent methyltransferase [Anaerosolibacter carboniphilus]MBB6217896.1 tRNA (adenine22-N1)-methyltransferase [Anaerosolibacter carboniphilus]